jgi:hypothetical protein
MKNISISIRMEEETISKINKIAELEDRDRSYIINKAVKEYLEYFKNVDFNEYKFINCELPSFKPKHVPINLIENLVFDICVESDGRCSC